MKTSVFPSEYFPHFSSDLTPCLILKVCMISLILSPHAIIKLFLDIHISIKLWSTAPLKNSI